MKYAQYRDLFVTLEMDFDETKGTFEPPLFGKSTQQTTAPES